MAVNRLPEEPSSSTRTFQYQPINPPQMTRLHNKASQKFGTRIHKRMISPRDPRRIYRQKIGFCCFKRSKSSFIQTTSFAQNSKSAAAMARYMTLTYIKPNINTADSLRPIGFPRHHLNRQSTMAHDGSPEFSLFTARLSIRNILWPSNWYVYLSFSYVTHRNWGKPYKLL